GDMVTEDAHDFYFNYLSLNSVAGSAGGYYSTPSDISKWMRTYLRGDFVSKTLVEEAKKTIPASGSQGGAYGLGLMKNTFSGQLAFGHGGDLVYSASSWYFPALDISITVCGNDQKFNSWTLLPVVNELLKTYNLWKVIAASENVLKENIELIINSNCITDKLTFNLTGYQISNDLKIDIQSIQGNKVYSEKINSSNQSKSIDISNLPSGLYILSVKNSNTILQSKKIVKN
ncbi:MAG: T9SS type A sorting domain-containing protein, partial [Saprospiraceae bacterium]